MALGALFTVLACIGAAAALRFLHSACQFVLLHFWKPSRPLKAYGRSQGDAYALVTGSSAGIGLGIARALVRQGFGVILLGHLADELASAAKTLGTSRVRTIVLDARTATPEQISAAVHSISDLHLSILVNNVGGIPVTAQPFRPLSTLTIAEVDAHVDLNARFMARLTNIVLPLLSAKRREGERSLILNLCSAARHGFPWIVMYSAAKAFNYAFSAALARELEDDPATAHIDCLAVVPSEVQSQSNDLALPGSAPTSDLYGSAVVGSVEGAVRQRRREVRPYWRHDLEIGVMERILPEPVMTHFSREKLREKKQRSERNLAKRR